MLNQLSETIIGLLGAFHRDKHPSVATPPPYLRAPVLFPIPVFVRQPNYAVAIFVWASWLPTTAVALRSKVHGSRLSLQLQLEPW